MKKRTGLIPCLLLAACLLLAGCGAAPAADSAEPEAARPSPDAAVQSPAPTAEPENGAERAEESELDPNKLKNPSVRVSIALEKNAEPDAVIAAIEEALGHELDVVWRIKTGNVLAVNLPEKEIPAVRLVEGVRSVSKDTVNELQPGAASTPSATA